MILRPGSYLAFQPCRMQFKQKIMKQIISLSIVSIVFDAAEMRLMNQGLRDSLDETTLHDGMASVPRHVHFDFLSWLLSLLKLSFVVLD